MIPIRDHNPTYSRPTTTIALIVINVLVFLAEFFQGGDGMQRFIWKYGYVPAELKLSRDDFREAMVDQAKPRLVVDRFGRQYVDELGRPVVQRQPNYVEEASAFPAALNILTCMFLHGGWMHLIGNMLYLWIFGNNIEDRLGPPLFVVFYLGTGVVGNLVHTFFDPAVVPLVGASGAISGVMGAYILLFPRTLIDAIVPAGWYWFTVRLPAWVFLGIYILLQNFVPVFRGDPSSTAYWAHIGGFASGAALVKLFPVKKHLGPPRVARHRVLNDDVDIEI